MDTLITIVHVLVCLLLIVIVLLQQGKGADVGATFGGSSQSLFGSDGPMSLLNKATTGIAIIFMVTSITLAYMSARSSTGSVMSGLSVSQKADVTTKADSSSATATPAEEAGTAK